MAVPASQAAIAAFLASPEGLNPDAPPIETHAAVVFLSGDRACKMKKAVDLGFLDFATLEKRKAALEAELTLNCRWAPQLYERLMPVTRAGDGYALDGDGEPVEWLLVMRRFAEADVLSNVAARGELDTAMTESLADVARESHRVAEIDRTRGGAAAMARVAAINATALREAVSRILPASETERLIESTQAALARLGPHLDARRTQGFVRRCHGDLHLGNIVRIEGRPVLFDCLEFSQDLATIDVLYDLAFLLMDLCERGLRPAANTVLNRYLLMEAEDERTGQVNALALLPLFLSMRAAVRAHVNAKMERAKEARDYLAAALAFLDPPGPRLLAVGGLSGTGKSTLARALAPVFGPAPGALLLRSDERRKRLFGRDPLERLPPEAYTREASATVYAGLMAEAGAALAAGHAVVLDAVFAHEDERAAAAKVAARAGVPFAGLWLDAASEVLRARVAARVRDASDADIAVLKRQLSFVERPSDWARIDAGGTPESARSTARKALGERWFAGSGLSP